MGLKILTNTYEIEKTEKLFFQRLNINFRNTRQVNLETNQQGLTSSRKVNLYYNPYLSFWFVREEKELEYIYSFGTMAKGTIQKRWIQPDFFVNFNKEKIHNGSGRFAEGDKDEYVVLIKVNLTDLEYKKLKELKVKISRFRLGNSDKFNYYFKIHINNLIDDFEKMFNTINFSKIPKNELKINHFKVNNKNEPTKNSKTNFKTKEKIEQINDKNIIDLPIKVIRPIYSFGHDDEWAIDIKENNNLFKIIFDSEIDAIKANVKIKNNLERNPREINKILSEEKIRYKNIKKENIVSEKSNEVDNTKNTVNDIKIPPKKSNGQYSLHKAVSYNIVTHKWSSYVKKDKLQFTLGQFDSEEEAYRARCDYLRSHNMPVDDEVEQFTIIDKESSDDLLLSINQEKIKLNEKFENFSLSQKQTLESITNEIEKSNLSSDKIYDLFVYLNYLTQNKYFNTSHIYNKLNKKLNAELKEDKVIEHSKINNESNLDHCLNTNEVKIPSKKSNGQYSLHKAVSYNSGNKKWVSYVKVGKAKNHLGYFDSEEEAYRARCDYLRSHNMPVDDNLNIPKKENSSIPSVEIPSKKSNGQYSLYEGVSFSIASQKWYSYVILKNGQKNLGLFDSEEEAYQARFNYLNKNKPNNSEKQVIPNKSQSNTLNSKYFFVSEVNSNIEIVMKGFIKNDNLFYYLNELNIISSEITNININKINENCFDLMIYIKLNKLNLNYVKKVITNIGWEENRSK